MRSRKAAPRGSALPPLLQVAVLAGALILGACGPRPPAAEIGTSDPALQGHAQWCNTNPPSGYCGVDDRR